MLVKKLKPNKNQIVTIYYNCEKNQGFIGREVLTFFLNYGGNWYESRKNENCSDTLIVGHSHGSRRIYS